MCGSEPKKNLRSFLFKVYPYFIHPVQKSRTKLDIHLNITLQQKHEKATTTIAGSVQCYSCFENFVEKKQKKNFDLQKLQQLQNRPLSNDSC